MLFLVLLIYTAVLVLFVVLMSGRIDEPPYTKR